MLDRQPSPGKEGRMLIVPENGGEPFYATLLMADEPLEEGTALNKTNLLKDATAALFGLGADAVPDDVLKVIRSVLDIKTEMEIVSYTGTGTYGKDNPTSVTFSKAPSVIVMLGYKSVDSGRWYQHLDLDFDNVYMLPTSAIPTEYTRGFGFGQERNYYTYGKKSEDGCTFSWYTYDHAQGDDGDDYDQCNDSSYEYYILGLSTGNVSDMGVA